MNNINSINGNEIYQIMQDLCNFGYRRAGTENAIRAEKYIYEKFKEIKGLEVEFEEFTFPRWNPVNYELCVIADKTPLVPRNQVIETVPYFLSGSTGPKGIMAEVVYVGNGTSHDFEDLDVENKIILIEGKMILNFHSTHHETLFNSLKIAKDKGALGAICINNSPEDSISYLFFGSIFGWKKRLPALSVNNIDGYYLKTLCTKKNGKLTVKFLLDVKKEKGFSNFIIGTLPGKKDDVILIGTHIDSTFTGAIDNAGANAGLILLAKYFAQVPLEKRKKTLIFVGWTGHELGLIGVNKFVKMHQDYLNKISTFIMLDGFASKGYYNQADGAVVETGMDEKRGLFISDNPVLIPHVLDAVLKYKLLPAAYVSAKQLPVSDLSPFILSNVPSIMIIGKPIYYHTKYDTVEKCTPDQLERSAKAHAEIIEKILEIPSEKIKEADGTLEDLSEFIEKKDGIIKPTVFFSVMPHPIPEKFAAAFFPTVFNCPESITLKFDWDFGDGATSSSIITRHSYEKAGTYEVIFTITDNYGNISSSKQKIRVIKK